MAFVLVQHLAATHASALAHFFRAFPEKQGGGAIGVVLSGTASDGTQGLEGRFRPDVVLLTSACPS